jgi:hypothetical protein
MSRRLLRFTALMGSGWNCRRQRLRTDSDELAKHTGEMGLVAHSAVKSELRKRLSSVQHDDLGVTNPPCFDIGDGSLTETPSECAGEVADAELHDGGEVRNAEVEVNIGLDVGD